jgi:hypothetical protein
MSKKFAFFVVAKSLKKTAFSEANNVTNVMPVAVNFRTPNRFV